MKTRNQLYVTAILLCLCLPALTAAAQTPDKKPAPASYKIDYTIYEIQDGKRVNPHAFTMHVEDDERACTIRIGNRVPITTMSKENTPTVQYIDVGLTINANLRLNESGLLLRSTVDVSSFAQPEAQEIRG